MALQLDMNKGVQKLRMELSKRGGLINLPQAEVVFDLDVSGSYDDEHRAGLTNDLMARLVPWGMLLDPDKQMQVFTFSDGASHAHLVGDVNATNYEGYVRKNVIDKVPGYGRGTDYAHVLRKNLELFGWIQPAEAKSGGGGMFGGLFGRKPAAPAPQGIKRRSLILFNTDGDNNDKSATRDLFAQMEREKYGVYVMFLAVSNQQGGFPFLQELADKYNNCGITVIRDVKKWVQLSDEEIADQIITSELIQWLKG
jgi:hypothetical protein